MGWAEALQTLGAGIGNVSNIYGHYADQEATAALKRSEQLFSERLEELRQNRTDARLDKELTVKREDIEARKAEAEARRKDAEAARDIQQGHLDVSRDQLKAMTENQWRNHLRDVEEPFDKAREEALNDPKLRLDETGVLYQQRLAEIERAREGAVLRAKYEGEKGLSEEERELVGSLMKRIPETETAPWERIALALKRHQKGEVRPAEGDTADADKFGGYGSIEEGVKQGKLTKEGENVRGQSGSLYRGAGETDPAKIGEPIGPREASMMKVLYQRMGDNTLPEPEAIKEDAKRILAAFSKEEIEQQYPGLYDYLAMASKSSARTKRTRSLDATIDVL